eukprot:TRINITY_DN19979_c0_g1_i1.p1 TRINITY_DN19979_c0_g1~~TRINITY_DN19979_c0_g1_i1.p1  ORF type:complete len:498 (+),score=98.32 TRINITY_DN19979_c0_g1_i1:62-1495(+)
MDAGPGKVDDDVVSALSDVTVRHEDDISPERPQALSGEISDDGANNVVALPAEDTTPTAGRSNKLCSVEDPRAILQAIAACTNNGLHMRKRRQVPQSTHQMERALAICEGRGRESPHPSVALETARVRLNLAATLSRGGRHSDALVAIRQAQDDLACLLEWASTCNQDDHGVVAIAEEARMLQCAAKYAESIELEPLDPFEADLESSSSTALGRPSVKAHSDARRLAEVSLPQTHALQSFPADGRAVCTPKSTLPADAVTPSKARERPPRRTVSLPHIQDAPQVPKAEAKAKAGTARVAASVAQGNAGRHNVARKKRGEKDIGFGLTTADLFTGRKGGKRGDTTSNIFSDFLKDADDAERARLGALHDGEQEDFRRSLLHSGKMTKLTVMSFEEQEQKKPLDSIYELRFTPLVHAMCMKSMTRLNDSRSQPSLLKECRKTGESPEVAHIKRLQKIAKSHCGVAADDKAQQRRGVPSR